MVKQGQMKKAVNQVKRENARVGYQVATNLMVYEGKTLWSKFNALLVANSIVLASIGLSMTVSNRLEIFSKGMPIVGIILCGFWFLLTKRSFGFYEYWISSAREIEKLYLNDSIQTISRGKKFAGGEKVEIWGEEKPLQMGFLDRLRVKWTSYLIIGLFSVIYAVILILNIQ